VHVSPPTRIASGLRPRRGVGVGVGEGDLLAGVGAGERLSPRALANRSSNGAPSMRTDSPPRRARSLATVFIAEGVPPLLFPSAENVRPRPRVACPAWLRRGIHSFLHADVKWTSTKVEYPCAREWLLAESRCDSDSARWAEGDRHILDKGRIRLARESEKAATVRRSGSSR
jgi:hypothetical protein